MILLRTKHFSMASIFELPGQSPNQGGIAQLSRGTLRRGKAIASHQTAKPHSKRRTLGSGSAVSCDFVDRFILNYAQI
jgi:hypothetical protein